MSISFCGFVLLGPLLAGVTDVPEGPGLPQIAHVAGRSLDQWREDFDHPNEFVRLRAVISVGPFGAKAAALLSRATKDVHAGVRYEAAAQLGRIGRGASSAAARLRRMQEEENDPAVLMAVAFALCRLEDPKPHLPVLIDRLASRERGMACSAAEFLGHIGPPAAAAVPALEKTFQNHDTQPGAPKRGDADYHVRGAVQNALRQITPGWTAPGSKP